MATTETSSPATTDPNLDLEALLREGEAAEFLRFSPRALQAWRYRGGGPRYVKSPRVPSAIGDAT